MRDSFKFLGFSIFLSDFLKVSTWYFSTIFSTVSQISVPYDFVCSKYSLVLRVCFTLNKKKKNQTKIQNIAMTFSTRIASERFRIFVNLLLEYFIHSNLFRPRENLERVVFNFSFRSKTFARILLYFIYFFAALRLTICFRQTTSIIVPRTTIIIFIVLLFISFHFIYSLGCRMCRRVFRLLWNISANQKSVNFNAASSPGRSKTMFSGLISRCTMSFLCMYRTASRM
eukprot:c20742_g1_i13.p1 GENE.c20742_g1_i13~~c20742_g1_i13.p1  ORF type:complete len:228 (-),score=41.42 c20742_g1_i13:302-985(-)